MGAFHAYDIRGIDGKDWDRETAYKVGYFIPRLLKADKVLVGRDCRVSSPEIHDAVIQGINDAGADVYDYLQGFKRVIINPEILEESEEKVTYSEGCLSIPNLYCDVLRPAKITLRYTNENFEEVTETLDKFACRMVQHELSHLDGNLFTDNVPPIRKKMIASKLQNIAKGKVHPHYNSKLK